MISALVPPNDYHRLLRCVIMINLDQKMPLTVPIKVNNVQSYYNES